MRRPWLWRAAVGFGVGGQAGAGGEEICVYAAGDRGNGKGAEGGVRSESFAVVACETDGEGAGGESDPGGTGQRGKIAAAERARPRRADRDDGGGRRGEVWRHVAEASGERAGRGDDQLSAERLLPGAVVAAGVSDRTASCQID